MTTFWTSTLEWKQSENPISVEHQQMNPTDAHLMPLDTEPTDFDGLSLSTSGSTFLDGNFIIGGWWYSIGYTVKHTANGVQGQPGYRNEGGMVATKTQLFVKGCPPELGKLEISIFISGTGKTFFCVV